MGIDLERTWREGGLGAALMSPLSALYAAGWLGYQSVYALGLKRPAKPHSPIVCVGNLLVGGAGKTPTTLHIASVLRSLRRVVVIGTSGYGSPRQENANWAPEGELDAAEWGDESAMIRWMLPEQPLIVGRDRVMAARICYEHAPDAVLLMDDGYQHLRLDPDVRILIDPEDQGNRLTLPAGPYREPRGIGRRRADLVLPGEFVVRRGFTVMDRDRNRFEPATGTKVNALCALARPQRFIDTLKNHGLEPVETRLLPDHDPMRDGTILAEFEPELPLVVTAKDWVKLRTHDTADRTIWVADAPARIEPADGFRKWLQGRLDAISK